MRCHRITQMYVRIDVRKYLQISEISTLSAVIVKYPDGVTNSVVMVVLGR